MLNHFLIKLVGEVVDGVSVKLDISLLVESVESQLIEEARPSQLFILKHVSHFIITEYCIFGVLPTIIEYP